MSRLNTIPVVHFDKAQREAYKMGYRELETSMGEVGEIDMTHYRDSARWVNVLSPKLRALAGFRDHGEGTYTEDRDVAVVYAEDADDVPIEANVMRASLLADDLIDSFDEGAYASVEGSDEVGE